MKTNHPISTAIRSIKKELKAIAKRLDREGAGPWTDHKLKELTKKTDQLLKPNNQPLKTNTMYSIRKHKDKWTILHEESWKERVLTKEEIQEVMKEHPILRNKTVLGIFHEKIESISNKP